MLHAIVQSLPGVCANQYEVALFKSAILLGFFGLLRVGEYTAASKQNFQKALQFQDVHIGQDLDLSIYIAQSKTDQAGRGAGLLIEPCSAQEICPGRAMKNYFQNYRTSVSGPAFIHADGTPLTSFQFSAILKRAVAFAGLETAGKTTHSLRIGACSMASAHGMSDQEIKKLGRWTSRAYKSYIRIPSNKIAQPKSQPKC